MKQPMKSRDVLPKNVPGVGWVTQGWGGVGHVRIEWGGMGWGWGVMQGWGGHTGVGWVM